MKRLIMIASLASLVSCGATKTPPQTAPSEPVLRESDAPGETASPAPVETAETASEDFLANDGTRKVGDVTKCPISGDMFTVTADSPHVEHEGKVYYFCCVQCLETFEANSEEHLSNWAKSSQGTGQGHAHQH